MASSSGSLRQLLDDEAVLVATTEQVAKSMNGPRAQRLSHALDDLTLDPSGSLLAEDDAQWLTAGMSEALENGRVSFWRQSLSGLREDGISVVSSISPDYPTNLQLVHDRPPLLFVRGTLDPADQRSIAIVGTREASDEGRLLASQLSAELSSAGVTILSGLAKGIDTAAHTAAVNRKARTVAVYGTPIDRVYPAANRGLADAIVRQGGACVSQFIPGTNTQRWGFPIRNVTMSGLALGTIVVEAGETSGARIQAEAAIAHGKRLFLVEQLVTHQKWARDMADLPLVTVAQNADAVLEQVERQLMVRSDAFQ